MIRVLSVSLGSAARDHAVRLSLLGRDIQLERRGTNGDLDRAVALLREHDGVVDAFGIGGIEFYLAVGERRFHWRDAKRIRRAIRHSKVGDGNAVRAILATRARRALERRLNDEGRTLRGMRALKTTGVSRWFLARELVEAGCDVTFGDFMFTLGLPIPVRSMRTVRLLGGALLPLVTQLPYRWLYALGDEQQTGAPVPRWGAHFAAADVIAGDYLQIRSCMPADLRGKIVVTNTTTARDVEELRARGVRLLVTETPRLEGRTFGTNVIEAMLLAIVDTPQHAVREADLVALIDAIPLEPSVEALHPEPGEPSRARPSRLGPT